MKSTRSTTKWQKVETLSRILNSDVRARDNYPPKILMSEPVGRRRHRKPRLRWKDGDNDDAREIGANNKELAYI